MNSSAAAAMMPSSVTVDLATGTATDDTNTVTWTPQVIENVIGGTANDDLSGNESDNTLNGQGGDDEISGGSGVDTVYGDSPDASTPAGDDTIDVADGGDTVDRGPNATLLSGDKVEVGAEQDLSTGEITRVDTATNCETVKEVLIN